VVVNEVLTIAAFAATVLLSAALGAESGPRIFVTSVFVDDQEKALRFYTDVLGFVKKEDIPLGKFRWLTVVSPRDPEGVELLLEPNENPAGKTFQKALFEQGIPLTTFGVDDLQKEYERLRKLQVAFRTPPTPRGDVSVAVFEDTCGNLIQLTQKSGGWEPPPGIVEVRSYKLKPGARDGFHERFLRESLPLLERFHVDVVAFGPSLHDPDSYYLMRAFPSLEERERSEDAFYGSDEWTKGPREATLADIESYSTSVVRLDAATLRRLRDSLRSDAPREVERKPSDLRELLELNQEYIRSVRESDVARFREILAEDFRASLPDGSLLDKAHFLELTARPATISGLAAHDVEVRMMGDVAIIHARTTFTAQDGRPGSGRYTDIWARRAGKWLAVAAHVTRN
jgi:catechol 2,3-dioxygenase-like lactoylglutathione lyase family enzyme/ketosteroid isomerase-like protein